MSTARLLLYLVLLVLVERVHVDRARPRRPRTAALHVAPGGGARTARSRAVYVDTLDEDEEDEVEREASS